MVTHGDTWGSDSAIPVSLSPDATEGNLLGVKEGRPSALGTRLDEVCAARGLSERAWSLAAGLSDKYLAVQRHRAADDPTWLLPEKAAAKLAEAAGVNVAWLRWGRGPRDPSPPDDETVQVARLNPRENLIRDLFNHAAVLTLARDFEAVRVINAAVAQLMGAAEQAHSEPEDVSGQRKRVGL